MAIEIERVDLELDMGPKFSKSKYTPGSIEIALRRGALTFSTILNHLYFEGCVLK